MLRSSALLKGSAAAVITLLVSASTALPAMPDHKAQTEASRKAILDFAREVASSADIASVTPPAVTAPKTVCVSHW